MMLLGADLLPNSRDLVSHLVDDALDWGFTYSSLISELSRVSDRDVTTQDSMVGREQGGLATEVN